MENLEDCGVMGFPALAKQFSCMIKPSLISIIINHLRTGFSLNKNIACIYVYFDHKKRKNQNAMSLFSNLLVQLLQSRTGICDKIKQVYEAYVQMQIHPTTEEYVEMLKCQMQPLSKVYIIVDALDECLDDSELNTLSNFLDFCQKLPENAHMLFTSRPGLRFFAGINPTCELEIIANADDMRHYLDKSICSHHCLGELIGAELKHDNLFRARVLDTIVERSKGMFLLAYLNLESLATEYTISGLKAKLKHLSKTPDEVYKATLERIRNQKESLRNLAINALTWLVFAERELTISELAHAIEIQDTLSAIQQGALIFPKGPASLSTESALTTACVGIVVVEAESRIVRLAHNTAEIYLRNNQSIIFENAQSEIARTCLSCLILLPPTPFNSATPRPTDLEKYCKDYPFLRYAADHWGDHLSYRVEGSVYKLAWEFLSDNRKVNNGVQFMANFQFRLEKDVSGLHILAYFGLAKVVKKAIEKKKRLLINCKTRRGETPLHWAAIYRQRDFLKFLVDHNADPNAADNKRKTSLHRAIYNGDEASVEALLSSKAMVDLTLEDFQGWTPLRLAAANGQVKILQMLLNARAEVDAQDKDGWTAVHWAAQKGHKAVVELLISRNASLEAADSSEWTLLRWAAKEGIEDIIKLLVEKGVDLDVVDPNGYTALHWAVYYGHAISAWLLVNARANVNRPDNQGKTTLHTALENCPSSSLGSIVCILLERGAKVNSTSKLNLTPLHFAATRGIHSVVWLLLEKGADPKLGDINDRKALHCAITAGYLKVVQLLAWKVESFINSVDDELRTALHYAASLGHLNMVEVLLNHGADINVCDVDRKTPLYLAVSQQHEEVVACLIRRNADVNIPDRRMRKRLLRLAADLGNVPIIQALHQVCSRSLDSQRNDKSTMSEEEPEVKKALGRYAARVEDE